ncbi:hypothetical protein ACWD6R_39285 [Streptomyces sp. NPDC005151]
MSRSAPTAGSGVFDAVVIGLGSMIGADIFAALASAVRAGAPPAVRVAGR